MGISRSSRPLLGLSMAALLAACTSVGGVTGPQTSAPPSLGTPAPSSAAPPSPPEISAGPPSPPARQPERPTASPTATVPVSGCVAVADRLRLDEQVGQLFMVGVPTNGFTAHTAAILARTRAGSVILLQNTTAGRSGVSQLTARIRASARAPKGVGLLIAADQEGGLVQRLKGPGFVLIPSARVQSGWSNALLTRRAKLWGAELKAAGVNADLAPVADVVPISLQRVNQPIGVLRRGFGPDPRVVAEKAGSFVRGMNEAGVASAVKHFPGLGRVRGNTDLVNRVVDSGTTRHDRALAGFRTAVGDGADMVMVSSAFYTRIDPGGRAAFSPVVIGGMLRRDLGFKRVVVSDDLVAPGIRDYSDGERALKFLVAGGDLVLVGDPNRLPAMVAAVNARAAADPAFARQLKAKVSRVLTLKAHRGLASC
jgi:beta-N-acetylhexosaminidase